MAVAVALRLDDDAAARVVALWERLYVMGLDATLVQPDAEPRLLLAMFQEADDAGRILSATGLVGRSWPAMSVTATGMTIFGDRSPTLALAVAPTNALLAWHEQLHTVLANHPCDVLWRPGGWTPAITVSEWALSVADAVRCLLPLMMEPFEAKLVALEVVDRLCGAVVASWDLVGR